MADPFIGQLKIFAGNYAPVGWVLCDGSLLPISEYNDLFSLLGTTYGGDGVQTFAVPDLRGRVPIGPGKDSDGNSYAPGTVAGSEGVTLQQNNGVPQHNHPFMVSATAGSSSGPTGNVLASTSKGLFMYLAKPATASMAPGMIGNSPGGAPHENRQPFLVINYIIATAGIYPSQP